MVYIIVVLNPDGYKYSWSDDRMWRKNRRPLTRQGIHNSTPSLTLKKNKIKFYLSHEKSRLNSSLDATKDICVGVDLNRNFDLRGKREMRKVCKEAYSGPKPFSEGPLKEQSSLLFSF